MDANQMEPWRNLEPFLGADVPRNEVVLLSEVKAMCEALSHPAPTPVAVPDVLTCDDCGAATTDPWHSSKGARRHYHRCDACHAEALAVPDVSDWSIDLSTGRKILVYKNCSVIEDEQAELIIAMLAAAPSAPASQSVSRKFHEAVMASTEREIRAANVIIDHLRAQLAERDAELSKSDARLHEVAVACATAEGKLAASEARVLGITDYVIPALAVLQAMCRNAGPKMGEVKAGEMITALSQPKGDSNDQAK